MVEKWFVLAVFLIVMAMLVNLFVRGALFRWAERAWRRVRGWPAARRRRVYQLNEFRATRKREEAKSRSTTLH